MLKKILFFSLLVFFTLSILANVKNWHILLYLQIAIPLIFLLLAWLDREYALYFLLGIIITISLYLMVDYIRSRK